MKALCEEDEGCEDASEVAFLDLMDSYYYSDDEHLVIDESACFPPSTDDDGDFPVLSYEDIVSNLPKQISLSNELTKVFFVNNAIESLDLSGNELTGDLDKYKELAFEVCIVHPNIKSINISNTYGVRDEERILKLFRISDTLLQLEHIDISYVQFSAPLYSPKRVFARHMWRTIAEHASKNMPNLRSVTTYGFPIKSGRDAIQIMSKGIAINANTTSVNGAEKILKRVPEDVAERSNLCNTWSNLVVDKKTHLSGYAVDDEFLDTVVPQYIKMDVTSSCLEEVNVVEFLTNVPVEVAILSFFPYFCNVGDRELTCKEVDVLYTLCHRIKKELLSDVTTRYSNQIELFVSLLSGDTAVELFEARPDLYKCCLSRGCLTL
ncbi:hypothetical protein Pcinc_008572 [Petrolisthes cinctipes]|uniref:Uncharacterized protein n=1 Tax=Petrolisthes cinctipes TaxID=88211 RepID=A0AAE1G699_PETCI|nr:hypothetical protein Pcinc_008572 [Petrolisthes cinctipes]